MISKKVLSEIVSKYSLGGHVEKVKWVVNEDNVIKALINEDISGYGTDVISDEFGDINNSKLVDASRLSDMNLLITPHVGGMTWEGQTKAYKWAINKFKGVQNEVN